MKLLFLSLLIINFNLTAQIDDYSTIVNPFIGTGGHGHTFPGATAPFGFVQLSPDTRIKGWDGCGGYHYSDSVIFGFSHTHLSGTGVSDLGDLLIMPFIGNNKWESNGSVTGYGSKFSHKSEKAEAGYYHVNLDKHDISVELTADLHSGFHSYIFPKNKNKKIIIDLDYRDFVIDSDLFFVNDSTIVGKRISSAWAKEQHIYFIIKLSEAPIKKYFQKNNKNKTSKIILEFNNVKNKLLIKTGLSAVDINGAKNNLENEIPHWNFEKTHHKVKQMWNNELSKIQIETTDEDKKIMFYTALYHSFVVPNIFSDLDGRYRGTDLKIHKSNSPQFTVFSLWDTFRATHPLYTIIQRKKTLYFIQTFLNQYKFGGKLPVWELDGNYTMCMIGYHSVSVICDAYNKGIRGFDTELALKAMIHSANLKHLGLYFDIKNGYISSENESESVSKTLEYAYDDWCIAVFSDSIGKDSIAKVFYERANHYKNIYNPETKFMQPKFNGEFKTDFNPREVTFDYTEANSWQYSLFTPQDITGLIKLLGGKDSLKLWLDRLFTASSKTNGRHQVDITGLIGQYAHGNEPSHHMAYLYNYTNKSSKTQYYVHKILTELYRNTPDGLSGNEDCGQMSSWYVLSSMGIYAITPGSNIYELGTPLFNYTQINLENSHQFKIIAKNLNKDNFFVKSVKLNGKTLNRNFIYNYEIINGGVLEFEMSNHPEQNYGRAPIKLLDTNYLAVPYLKNTNQTFSKKINISIFNPNTFGTIKYYTANHDKIKTYKKPIKINQTDSLTSWVEHNYSNKSHQVTSVHKKINDKWDIKLNSKPHPQYEGESNKTLIDKQYGSNDFRNGYWQGFYAQDMDVEIDFHKKRHIKSVSVHLLQDANSWIWYPTTITFFYFNGKTWIKYDEIKNTVSPKEYGGLTKYITSNKSIKTKRIKIVAKNIGNCPSWHPGAGNPAFIFADEIEVIY